MSTNSTVAPDGTLTATKLIESPTNSSHGLTRSYDWVNYTSLVLSVYVKPAERSILSMSGYNSAGDLEFVYFNLSNGTTSNSTKGRIETMRDGWYRCILLTAGGGFGGPRIHLASTPVSQTYQGSSQSYSGDGNSGIYIWGVQYEIGTFPTSYIPTTTSPVTRSIDTVSITGPNFSNWYNQNEGTLFQNVVSRAPIGGPGGSNAGIGAIMVASPNNMIGFTRRADAASLETKVYDNSLGYSAFFSFNWPQNTKHKSILSYKTNDFAASADGQAVQTDNSGAIPLATQLDIGYMSTATYNRIGGGTFSRITYWPTRIPNASLQTITQ